MTAMFPGIRGERRMFLMTQDKSCGHFFINLSAMVSDFPEYSFMCILFPNDGPVLKSSYEMPKRKFVIMLLLLSM